MRIAAFTAFGLAVLAGPACAKNADKELDAWVTCLKANGETFAGQDVPAETATEAAFGACTPEETETREKMRKTPTLERMFLGPRSLSSEYQGNFERDFARNRDHLRSSIIAAVLNYRAGKGFTN